MYMYIYRWVSVIYIYIYICVQLSSELFIKRSAYTKVVGIHNIQKLDSKKSGGGVL